MSYKLILGNRRYSGWSLRAWLLFKHFGIDCVHEVVPLYTEEFERFRKDCIPARQLPTLIVTEAGSRQVIWDSLSIVELLNERHPDVGIWPSCHRLRAAARSLCAEVHSGFTALRSKLPVNLDRRYTTFTPDGEAANDIERICGLWNWARTEFQCGGPYLFGENMSAADVFFTPIASRFRTYSIALDDRSRTYADLLLHHPAVVEFVRAAKQEVWKMEHNEFDLN